MVKAKEPSAPTDERRLVILADGGALQDLNARLAAETALYAQQAKAEQDNTVIRPTPPKDFIEVPLKIWARIEEIEKATNAHVSVSCPVTTRIIYTVGSEAGKGLQEKMRANWTVKAFPLSFGKYDRANTDPLFDRHKYKIRFHSYIGYVLGRLAGTDSSKNPIVAVVTDDPHLVPCLSECVATGVDARIVWWEGLLNDELTYFATRNNVPINLLSAGAGSYERRAAPHPRDLNLEDLLVNL